MCNVRFVGVGSYVPERRIDNESIARAVPGWPASRIEEKTGIVERRFLWELDAERGRSVAPPKDTGQPRSNTDMCEIALGRALEMAGVKARELDAILLVTCSPDRLNFCHDAMELHRRLGCRPDAHALVFDSGCGGTLYAVDLAWKMLRGETFKTIAVLGSNFTSSFLDREVFTGKIDGATNGKALSGYLSMYVFGDGAGAVILRGDQGKGAGIVSSFAGSAEGELVVRRAGGAECPGGPSCTASPADWAFIVDGPLVAQTFPVYMKRCLRGVFEGVPTLSGEVKRYYFHQPNKRLLDHFVEEAGLPKDRVPTHVERYGNTSAAGMLILLSEDLARGAVRLGGGDLVCLAAVGAGVHYGAQLVRL
ncbi:MAG: 3-ketoacyl-ACP synthase [Deltaproteobacteria bacterium]|nr:3-ketoacyl-ACP synthase [Deltaproteobacteria bacterium]